MIEILEQQSMKKQEEQKGLLISKVQPFHEYLKFLEGNHRQAYDRECSAKEAEKEASASNRTLYR